MQSGEPSRTAVGAARHRARHQVLEGGRVFTDPFALRAVGWTEEDAVDDGRRGLRLFIAARHRIAEDVARERLADGGQVVLLGAGLDTFAARAPEAVRVFSVDFPATLAWARSWAAEHGVPTERAIPVPVDFERDDLVEALATAGLDRSAPTVVLWLGVVPYLTLPAIARSLSAFGSLPDATIVFDYPQRSDGTTDTTGTRAREELRARVAAAGEPIVSELVPEEVAELLADAGFAHVDDLDADGIVARLGGERRPGPAHPGGGRIVVATTYEKAR